MTPKPETAPMTAIRLLVWHRDLDACLELLRTEGQNVRCDTYDDPSLPGRVACTNFVETVELGSRDV